ncbi:hypothetical protein GGQ88_003971 [Novosphingobium hassiacum]|uniref:Uncharacterized protein n=1 Tax=Novosphingobium hassiacum TaxID=173676 RepID=A0A7W6EYB4_9SPHN|nr:hypothetical protein [Novosphingobium hassiacum]MBB3862669.1 hypothetical protein [Novosphingobium hassiacum]
MPVYLAALNGLEGGSNCHTESPAPPQRLIKWKICAAMALAVVEFYWIFYILPLFSHAVTAIDDGVGNWRAM